MSRSGARHFIVCNDGLKISYRDYGAEKSGVPVLCLPGLTRNSRDFNDLATRISSDRRVISVDLRGRGYSDYDPNWGNYNTTTYIADLWGLLDSLNIDRVVVIGTSLGGLCAMAMAAEYGNRVAGVILNDIGPEIAPAGLARIELYTGRLPAVSDWDGAMRQTREVYGAWLVNFSDDDFLRMARRAYREIDSDVPRLDFDANIGRAIRDHGSQQGDPWALFSTLRNTPVTLLWGSLSDILTADIVQKMKTVKPDMVVVPVAERGHVPLLDEPESLAAIDAFLNEIP